MSDKTIIDLSPASAAALTQIFEVVTSPGGTPASEKVSLNQIKTLLDTIYDAIGAAAAAQAAAEAASDPVGSASTVQGNLNTHTGLTGTSVHGLGTASTAATGDFDAAGAAASVAGDLSTHEGLTGTSVHGLGTASTAATGDFDAAGAAAAVASASVAKTLFDANTILKADSDDTPAALTVAEQTLVGRITSGVIAALTATQVRTLLNVADGADVTGSNAPQTHKDSHDPEDGGDALDTEAAAEITGVQAAATGSSHSLARADHSHAINHGISDNHLVTIDSADAATGEYAKFTANGLESKSASEVRSDLNVEDGADVTDATNVAAAGATMKSLFDANTILAATTDDTPATVTVAEQTLVGRITSGNIAALTATQARTLLNVADGADATLTALSGATSGITLGRGLIEKSVTISSSSNELTLSNDYNTQNVLNLAEDTEIQLPDMSGWAAGTIRKIDLYIEQDGTGGRVVTFESGWKFAGNVAPTPSTGLDEIDHYVIVCNKDLNICTIGLAEADLS